MNQSLTPPRTNDGHGPQLIVRPAPAGARSADCPVLSEVITANTQAHDLKRTLRRLRRKRKLCQACAVAKSCPVNLQWNNLIQQAISEVIEELNALGHPPEA